MNDIARVRSERRRPEIQVNGSMPERVRNGNGVELCFIVALVTLLGNTSVFGQNNQTHSAVDNLVTAYPKKLVRQDDNAIRWQDGTVMSVSDGISNKTFSKLLRNASILDQFRIHYPLDQLEKPPSVNSDPGRFRNTAFFKKMYGDCRKGEVEPRLVSLRWLPKSWGKSIRITALNGVDENLRAISTEIDTLPQKIKRAAYPIAGTYNCRTVADTGQPSPHSYGIAIDLNTSFSDYWYWQHRTGPIVYRNRMPEEVVSIFEKHGFIWGGKWYHFDTMHFEYRPELLLAAQSADR